MPERLFNRVTIIGPGLIGASMGLALKRKGLVSEIVGVGRRESSLALAREAGAIDRSTLNPAEGVQDADLVVLATGIVAALKIGLQVMPSLRPGALLTDVASAKSFLIRGLSPAVRPDITYVSTHPMAGSERKGPAAARADLFEDALCIITRTPASKEDGVARLREMWLALGSRVCELDAETHDRILAEVSHLPHLAASALVNSADPGSLPYSASGFRDTTRIASGDPEIWHDIALCNREALAAVLRRYGAEIAALAEALEKGEGQKILEKLAQAKQKRDEFYADR